MAAGNEIAGNENRSDRVGPQRSRPSTIVAAIVILLIYQGYSLSIVGVASPWIAQTFALDQPALARLFAWMSLSAFGTLALARLADRVGRRRIILMSLIVAPICAAGAGLARTPAMFVLFEILISAMLGGSVSSAIVLLAEELPSEQRAQGQAFAALASALGGVLAYIVIPFLLESGHSWRWLLVPSIAGIVLVPLVARMLPLESRWSRGSSERSFHRSRFADIFHPLYRRRTYTILACAALDTMAGTAVNGWMYFETVSVIGLSPQRASLLVVAGMGIGMLGFPLGAWASNRFGRVPTVMYVGGAAWLGALAFYMGPSVAVSWPFLFLLISYSWFKIGTGVMTVGANAAATELFPASLRATMIGCQSITAAVFSMLAQILIAALIGPLGGLSNVIRYFALLGIPSAILFGMFIDETAGVPLEIASREEEWEQAQSSSDREATGSRRAANR
jgi:MFS family permease